MDKNEHNKVRVMGLHSIVYCERLYFLEEVEGILVADENVFDGRSIHLDIDLQKGTLKKIELSSEKLGLVGKVDTVRRRDGSLVPYEYKRGKALFDKKEIKAWEPDIVQLAAYAILLEEKMGETIIEGRIRYQQSQRTVKVIFDDKLRNKVKKWIKKAQDLQSQVERPSICNNENKCIKCSLSPVCLPEEERLIQNKDWEPVRLFPPERENKVIHIIGHKKKIKRKQNKILIEEYNKGEEDKELSIQGIQSMIIHGYSQITTQALHLCSVFGVDVHWLTPGGNYSFGVSSGPNGVQRRIRQYNALILPENKLILSKKLAKAKVESQVRYLLRQTRGRRDDETRKEIKKIQKASKGIENAESIEIIRGFEGIAGKTYFSLVKKLFNKKTPSCLKPVKRTRRPPKDRFNALLSFGYSLLYQSVYTTILAVGLEPSIGFFHQPRTNGFPLVLDLMELFRLPIWDITVIGAINRGQIDGENDFIVTKEKVWLSREGKRKAIQLFEKRLTDKWKHPITNYSLSYERTIELETRLLEKEWCGSSGLFARGRLR